MNAAKPAKPASCAIVGLGVSGRAVKDLLIATRHVHKKDFVTFDDKSADADFSDPAKLFTEFNPKTLIVSPGVPLGTAWIQEAQKNGLQVTSEIRLAAAFLEKEKVIAVTGSLGKSTTVSLLGAALKRFSNTAFVGGNLGTPLAQYVTELLSSKRSRADWVVLELSSYQIENMEGLPVDFAAITYLAPNHLERYANLEEYYTTKWKLIERAKHSVALNARGGDLETFAKSHPPAQKPFWASANQSSLTASQLQSAHLVGQHNKDNIALAWKIAELAGWPSFSIQGMLEFNGLAHRSENIGVRSGIRFINDSKATAIESVLTAIDGSQEGLGASSRVIVLLGGRDKKLPWAKLSTLNFEKVSPIFFGECGELARAQVQINAPVCKNLSEAFQQACQTARSGDTILLSPGGTSLDEFKNFEHRGDRFKELVSTFVEMPQSQSKKDTP